MRSEVLPDATDLRNLSAVLVSADRHRCSHDRLLPYRKHPSLLHIKRQRGERIPYSILLICFEFENGKPL